jgi:hypothetical protein
MGALTEFVFLLADDENGTWRSMHNSLGRAADTEVPPTGVAVGGDDD